MSVALNIMNDIPPKPEESPDLPDHLGGHEFETHIDEGALKHLIKKFGIKSMIDVGCGPGGMVKKAKELGLQVVGVDGDFTIDREMDVQMQVYIHDYSKSEYVHKEPWQVDNFNYEFVDAAFDLAWCVEFLEHVDAEYIYNFMATFRQCKYVICTHAFPGQPGKHHVNCRDHQYWVDIFTAFGFEVDPETTNEIREASTMGERYMRQQSLFFKRRT